MMFALARRFFRPGRRAARSQRTAKARQPRLTCQTLEGREVPAAGLGIANDFSAFILRDLNVFTSDIQGRVAVGGNASLTAYGLGDRLSDSDGTRDDLIVGGNLSFTNGQVFFGNVVHGGTGTFGSFGIPNGTTRQGSVLNFGAAEAELEALSDSYAGLATNGTVQNQFGTIILTGTQAGQNVFNVPAAMLWDANDLIIRAPAGSSAAVNVTGSAARMQFMGFHLEGIAKESVILNFPEATSLTFQGIGVHANVLAPRAAVDFSNGQLNGTLVADAFSGYGQINLDTPPPPPPAPPPPPPPPPVCPPLPPSQISGMVYFDKNKDGQPQDHEHRFEGVTVTLTGADQGGAPVTRTTSTDRGGIYWFTGLPAGTYSIDVATPDGYQPGQSSAGAFGGLTQPNLITQVVIPGGRGSGGYNFGEIVYELPPPPPPPPPCDCGCPPVVCDGSKVSGLVYFDKNQDGIPQDNDWRLFDVVVLLTGTEEDGGAVSLQTTTDDRGIFEFAGLDAGTYTITVETPPDFIAFESSVGAFGGVAGANVITGIQVTDCQSSGGYNFGEIQEGPRPR